MLGFDVTEILFQIGKAAVVLVFLYCALLLFLHVRCMLRWKHYEK
jgi:hypothetical protein